MIELLGHTYQLIRNDDCFNLNELTEKITEYFESYDYICGDYNYQKLRLKGFYESTNKKATAINSITGLEDYISSYCAYGAKIFLLKKEK